MTPKQLANNIRDFCIANADESIVKKYSRYFKEGIYDAYGVPTEKFRDKLKDITSDKSLTLDLVTQTAPLLFKCGKYEETTFAIMLMFHFKKEFTPEHFDKIGDWFSIGINNWAHADTLGMQVLPWFIGNNIVSYNAFSPWISSTYKFKRRTVPVTLIKSLKNEKSYTKIFRFIEPLMMDESREVHQGVGWFLREAWKKNPDETEKFLHKWKDKSPRLIYQYACEKMDKKCKEKFRRKM